MNDYNNTLKKKQNVKSFLDEMNKNSKDIKSDNTTSNGMKSSFSKQLS